MLDAIKQITDHLAKQRAKSSELSDEGATFCAYRGKEGTMCAVGCLIPDELYSPDLERKGIDTIMWGDEVLRAHFNSLLGAEAGSILRAAQSYHDDGAYRSDIFTFENKSDEEFADRIFLEISRIRGELDILAGDY